MIEFIDLKEQYEYLQNEINNKILAVLKHGRFILGPEVKELEQELANYVGVKHAISCSNGTDALLMPLMAWGIGIGDAVFTTPFTFISTAEVISFLGATPVFVDIDPDTYNIDIEMLEQEIKRVFDEGKLNPRVIIPVDLFGLPSDYEKISLIAGKYNLKVLEDAAQSFGSIYKGKRAGGLGDTAGTSFFPAKPLGCYGDGGAMFTDDEDLAEKLLSIRVHGQGKDKYKNTRIGINGRLDTLQAAILLVKLKAFDKELAARNRIASEYTSGLKNILKTPVVPDGLMSSWAQYSVCAENHEKREIIQENLKKAGVPTAVYYPLPLHLQEAFCNLNYKEGDFPVSEAISRNIFSLPMHPYIKKDTIDTIIEIIQKC